MLLRFLPIILTAYLAFFCSFVNVSAQNPQPSPTETTPTVNTDKFIYSEDLFAFADLRYGYSMVGQHFHLGGNFKYTFNLFKLSFTHSNNFANADSLRNQMNELGLLYGWSFRKDNFLFSVSFGVSGNWGSVTTNRQQQLDTFMVQIDAIENAKSIGFPMEINFSFTPPPKLKIFSSIGVSFFGNFNSKKSYFGGGLNLALGKLSPKPIPGTEEDKYRDYYAPKERRPRWMD